MAPFEGVRIPGDPKGTPRASPIILSPSLRLRRAIYKNDASLVARILKNSPHLIHNPDHKSSTISLSNSSLHLAAELGHLPIVHLLVFLGHEIPTPALNEQNQTALMLAARAGHVDVVHFLAETYPETIPKQDKKGRNALMEAAENGHDTALQILLTYVPGGPEESLTFGDEQGNTALHMATANGHTMVMRTLMAAGADPDLQNHECWKPINFSATVQVEIYLRNLIAEAAKRRTIIQQSSPSKDNNASARTMKMRLMGSG